MTNSFFYYIIFTLICKRVDILMYSEAVINNIIRKIHNYIYANEGLNNFEVLEEVLKVLYCKTYDETHKNLLTAVNSDEELYNCVTNLLNTLTLEYPSLYEQNNKFNLKKKTIIFVFNELSPITVSNIDTDIKGHLLQRIIDRSFREGRGQFFTPSPVIDFIINMIAPQQGELGCDPACGTGGFMFSAIEFMCKNGSNSEKIINNVYFYDISKTISRLITMRMMFEFGINKPNICVQDSLETQSYQQFDYILSNPPFGSQGKITDASILSKYVLGCDEDGSPLKSQVPDILFVEQIINQLKDGGRCAIVLPDGNFENPTTEYLRKFVFQKCKIDAIVSLPDGTFVPYGTGVKSSILFLTKNEEAHLNPYNVFMGRITKLGYTFSKHSKPLYTETGAVDEDYSYVLKAYKEELYDEFNFIISSTQLQENKYLFSYNKYCLFYGKIVDEIKATAHSKLFEIITPVTKKIKIDPEKEYKYIEISNVSAENCEITSHSICYGSELPSRASYILEEDDIIVAISGSSIGSKNCAKAIVTKEHAGCICTNGFIVLRKSKISPYLLLHFFNSFDFRAQVCQSKYGTAIPTISKEDFMKISFRRFAYDEENRIINLYQKAFSLRQESKELLQSI